MAFVKADYPAPATAAPGGGGGGSTIHFAADEAAAQALITAGTAVDGDVIVVNQPFSIFEVTP